jgi:protein-ribulosamine 3-kinase
LSPWEDIGRAVAAATATHFTIDHRTEVGGGCINAARRIEGGGRAYFVKLNGADKAGMFAAEAEGLQEIARTRTLRVPRPVCHGANETASWLVLEYVAPGRDRGGGMRALGTGLAAMHRGTGARFGWRRDNTIGATPQINTPADDWIEFWREHRLGFQLALAARNGFRGRLQSGGEKLLADLAAFFAGHHPPPSLLHGDLWSGNAGFDEAGRPVVFDPAVYYGDREADVAMTELFGGFSADFYAAYREALPLDAGYAVRKDLYNLYHVLNHLNLFGGGYLAQAGRLIEKLLAEV